MDWSYYFLPFIWNAQYFVSANGNSVHKSTVHKFQGESVLFPLNLEKLDSTSDLTLKKNNIYLFKWKKNDVDQRYADRLTFHENRTLKLEKLQDKDAGPYEVQLFDMAGKCIHNAVINVILICVKGFHEVHGVLGAPVAVFEENLVGLSNISDAKWEKSGSLIAQLQQSRPVYTEEYSSRVKIFTTGKCTLLRADISDEGNHTLDVSDGDLRLRWSAQLVMRVPQPLIEYSCLSDVKAKYRCSVNSELQTLWILNGSSLEKNDLVLDYFTGELYCMLKEYPDQNVSVSFTCMGTNRDKIAYILAPCFSVIIVAMLSVTGYCGLRHNLWHRHGQSLELTTMVPTEVLETCEVTGTDEFPPPPPSILEEEGIYTNITMRPEMSTFI
ncbi:hypothetical protein AAFF_G00319360 [Aldrovandia affinis]|uniref:Ig-like domain-containing protein n=1 Tax=Aldrovandia affinis TaxID=143900 RepID=A0AAD7WQN8_9TELE|nr:hypothetical protein AAFF_G00319360 [Aldrovandia affinis]